MSRSAAPVRAPVATGLAVLLTALSVAVPLLDLGRSPAGVAVVDPGEAAGYVDHHHGVCLQHSATAWAPAAGTEMPAGRLVREDPGPGAWTRFPCRSLPSLPHSRAPPIV